MKYCHSITHTKRGHFGILSFIFCLRLLNYSYGLELALFIALAAGVELTDSPTKKSLACHVLGNSAEKLWGLT